MFGSAARQLARQQNISLLAIAAYQERHPAADHIGWEESLLLLIGAGCPTGFTAAAAWTGGAYRLCRQRLVEGRELVTVRAANGTEWLQVSVKGRAQLRSQAARAQQLAAVLAHCEARLPLAAPGRLLAYATLLRSALRLADRHGEISGGLGRELATAAASLRLTGGDRVAACAAILERTLTSAGQAIGREP